MVETCGSLLNFFKFKYIYIIPLLWRGPAANRPLPKMTVSHYKSEPVGLEEECPRPIRSREHQKKKHHCR